MMKGIIIQILWLNLLATTLQRRSCYQLSVAVEGWVMVLDRLPIRRTSTTNIQSCARRKQREILFLPPSSSSLKLSNLFSTRRKNEIVEPDFERVDHESYDDTIKGSDKNNFSLDDRNGKSGGTLKSSKSLLELSLESDPDWNEMRIPFIEPYTSGKEESGYYNYIDVKLAFIADLDGVKYGIGVPCDAPVALTVENLETGAVQYLSPDNDDNRELMEIMAAQVHESFGEDLQLQRTPRVLTISGPLDEKYLKNWKDNILPDPVPVKDLLNHEDEDLSFFHRFMKEELGEEEYMKTINESSDDGDDEISEELLRLFDTSANGNLNNDTEKKDSIDALLETVMGDPDDEILLQMELEKLLTPGTRGDDTTMMPSLNHEGVALKLVSYILPPSQSENQKGKSYSLVKLLKPYALVGKYTPLSSDSSDIEGEQSNTRFELMTLQQEKIIIPKLEELFWQDLKESGLTFQPQ